MKENVKHISQLVRKALMAADEKLQRGDTDDFPGLEIVRTRLKEMLESLEAEKLPDRANRNRGIGRIVIDSWPLDSELGELVTEAEQAYIDI